VHKIERTATLSIRKLPHKLYLANFQAVFGYLTGEVARHIVARASPAAPG